MEFKSLMELKKEIKEINKKNAETEIKEIEEKCKMLEILKGEKL